MFAYRLHGSTLPYKKAGTTTSHDIMCSCCLPQTGSNASSGEEEVAVTQFAKGVRINIHAKPGGVVVGTICVKDAQPPIPTGWNDLTTRLGDYVSVSHKTAKPTAAAKNHVAEQEEWAHYLRLDWTKYNPHLQDDEDDDDDDARAEREGWELTLNDIVEMGADFLIYREFLSLITPKPKKKKSQSAGWAPAWPPRPARPTLPQPSPARATGRRSASRRAKRGGRPVPEGFSRIRARASLPDRLHVI